MKKLLAICSICFALCATFTGCGSDDTTYDSNSETVTEKYDRDTVGERAEDALDGAGEAGRDIIGGVTKAFDDVVDGINGTSRSTSADR